MPPRERFAAKRSRNSSTRRRRGGRARPTGVRSPPACHRGPVTVAGIIATGSVVPASVEMRICTARQLLRAGRLIAMSGRLYVRMLNRDDLRLALTFDDVLLLPARATSLPKQVETSRPGSPEHPARTSRSSRRPWTPSPRRGMAIAMAPAGRARVHPQEHDRRGAGAQVVQGQEVRVGGGRPTRSPSSPTPRSTRAVELMREHGISGIPVVEKGQARRHPHQPRPALREEPRRRRSSR